MTATRQTARLVARSVAASLVVVLGGCAQLERWWCGEPPLPPPPAPDERYDAEVRALEDEIGRYKEALAAGACSERSFELVPEPLAVSDIKLRPNAARPEPMKVGALLERSTVLVLGPKGLRATGFFVTPRDVVTIADPAAITPDDVVLLAWAAEHVPARAKLVKGATDDGLVLLRLEEGESPGIPLVVGPPPTTRSTIVAAAVTGSVDYPAAAAVRDAGKAIGGSLSLALTRGEAIPAQGGYELVHTAGLADDASGGPLVDACGRVFGVAVRAEPEDARTQRYAVLAMADRGALAEAPAVAENAPCVQSTPEPSVAPTPSRVEIPREAIAEKDVSFLEGHWRMYQRDATGTFSPDFEAAIGGKPQPGLKVHEDLRFDARGNGEREIGLSDGRSCHGPSRARIENGKLVIRNEQCQALNWVGATVTCEPAGAGAPAKCTSQQDNAQPFEVWLVKVAE